MREENVGRLRSGVLDKNNQHYIVNYFLFQDLEMAIQEFGKGAVLDVGCGNKPYKKYFQQTYTEYIGCDMVQSDLGLVDVICPANDLFFPDNRFDTLLCTQVLEHVFDHNGALSEMHRVLKPGGRAIITVPFAWELHEEPYDFFRFSKYSIIELAKKHGFELTKLKANGGKWATIGQLFLNAALNQPAQRNIPYFLSKHFFKTLRGIRLFNKMVVYADKKFNDDTLTMNYLAVIEKKCFPVET